MAKPRPRRTSPLHYTPAIELFKPSRDLVAKHIWVFAPIYSVFVIFSIHSWLWSPGRGEPHHWWNSGPFTNGPSAGPYFLSYGFVGFSVFWFIFTAVVGTIAQVMIQAAQLEAAEGKAPTFERLWQTAKELGLRMFGLYIISALVILAGFLLLIIPGLFMVKRYFLAPYVMLEKKTGIVDSLNESAKISHSFSSIWGIILVMIGIGLLSVVPFVGWLMTLVLSFLYSCAPALRYHELKRAA